MSGLGTRARDPDEVDHVEFGGEVAELRGELLDALGVEKDGLRVDVRALAQQ